MMQRREREERGGAAGGRRSHNDIKKLRRENEQLRREIWCLRDEYDKLEEIIKNQKNREDESGEEGEDDSEELESRSEDEEGEGEGRGKEDDGEAREEDLDDEDEANVQSDSVEDDDSTEEEEEEEEPDRVGRDPSKNEQLDNVENQKISSHRLRVDFDDLSVVDEEEELKKDKSRRPNEEETSSGRMPNHLESKIQENYPYFSSPFVFPSGQLQYTNHLFGYSATNTNTTGPPSSLDTSSTTPNSVIWNNAEPPLKPPLAWQNNESGRSPLKVPTPNGLIFAPSTPDSGGSIGRKGSTDLLALQETSHDVPARAPSSPSRNHPGSLVKSVSCHNLQGGVCNGSGSDPELHLFATKSENNLDEREKPDGALRDNAKSFKSQLNVTLRVPRPCQNQAVVTQTPTTRPDNVSNNNNPFFDPLQFMRPLTIQVDPDLRHHPAVQVTSFEKPNPYTLTPFETLCPTPGVLRPGNFFTPSTPGSIAGFPFYPSAAAIAPTTFFPRKIPVQTQTSLEEESQQQDKEPAKMRKKKKHSIGGRKNGTGGVKSRKGSTATEHQEESARSSSSGQDSPRKGTGAGEHKRLSVYFRGQQRPSVSSVKTIASLDKDHRFSRNCDISDHFGEMERTNSVSSRDTNVLGNGKSRKNSTGSGKVPWCACWGNGCV